jgi:hypothetical protein
MKKDPIVAEIRKYRNQHAAQHGYDLRRIYRDLKAKEGRFGHKLATRKPKIVLRQTGS